MPIDVGDVIAIVAKMTQAGQKILNVYNALHTGIGAVTDGEAMIGIGAWLETFYGEFFGVQTDGLTYDTFEVSNLTTSTPIGEEAFPVLTVGGANEQASPLQIAAVLRFPSDFLGSQGRKFVPGMTEVILDANGELTSTMQAALVDGGLALLVGFTAGGEQFDYGAYNEVKDRFATFQSVIVNDIVGTQRRRKQGVGK